MYWDKTDRKLLRERKLFASAGYDIISVKVKNLKVGVVKCATAPKINQYRRLYCCTKFCACTPRF